jgi:hypothetical protein
MMSSNISWEARTTSQATVRTWLRAPFGLRGERTAPTRPNIDYDREMLRLRMR